MFPPTSMPYYRPPPPAGATQTPASPVPATAAAQQLSGAPAISESQRVSTLVCAFDENETDIELLCLSYRLC